MYVNVLLVVVVLVTVVVLYFCDGYVACCVDLGLNGL